MEAKSTKVPHVLSSPEDAQIDKALADLDKKLEAWSGAATDLERALQDLAGQPDQRDKPEEHAPTLPEAQEASEQQPKVPDASGDGEARDRPETVAREGEQLPEQTDETAALSPDGREGDSQEDEDQRLLATLDEEAAHRLRVIRRLNPEKTVKELIEKYQLRGQTQTSEEPRKKSWWRR